MQILLARIEEASRVEGDKLDVTLNGRGWPFPAIDDASKALNGTKLKPSVTQDGQ